MQTSRINRNNRKLIKSQLLNFVMQLRILSLVASRIKMIASPEMSESSGKYSKSPTFDKDIM